jgi:hypothetical protein
MRLPAGQERRHPFPRCDIFSTWPPVWSEEEVPMDNVKGTVQAAMSALVLSSMLILNAPLVAGAQSQEVIVTNPPTQPIPVMTGAVEPFQRLRLANFAGSSSVTLNFLSPGGTNMLVVEHTNFGLRRGKSDVEREMFCHPGVANDRQLHCDCYGSVGPQPMTALRVEVGVAVTARAHHAS